MGKPVPTGLAAMLAFLISMAFVAAAQEEIKPFGRRIVGGEKTDIKQHPWQVALQIRTSAGTQLCGGSIISQRWVLTAAHCFNPSTVAGQIKTKAGATDYVQEGVWAEVERVVRHGSYNGQTHENDIALIKLKSAPPPGGRVIPLAAASASPSVGQPLEVTGWGATKEGGGASRTLYKATVPYADTAICNQANSYNGGIKSGMLCAGYRDGGVDSCQGDSGGPLVWRTADGPVLVGVVSHGEGCARKLKYGVYTRVSAYKDWIDRVIAADR